MARRIGLLIPNLLPGGAERVISNISKILSKDYDIFLFVFDSDNISYDYCGQLIDLNCKAQHSLVLKALMRLLRIIKLSWYNRKIKPEIMISFMYAANMVNVWSLGKTKKIISCRGYGDFLINKLHYYKSIKKVDALILQTDRMKNEFLEEYHADAGKVCVLKNPFDSDSIIKMSKEPIGAKHAAFYKNHKTICTVSSFKRDKGLWHLIKAFHEVKKTESEAGLIIVGHGGPMEKDIFKMAEDSYYREDILLTGYQKNPFSYISKADVFACTSIYEGFPNALIEAMLCMTPVVSTDCLTGPKEIICDSTDIDISNSIYEADRGILTPPLSASADFDINNISENEKLFASGIMKLLNERGKAKAMAARAFEKVKQYDYDSFARELSVIINK